MISCQNVSTYIINLHNIGVTLTNTTTLPLQKKSQLNKCNYRKMYKFVLTDV